MSIPELIQAIMHPIKEIPEYAHQGNVDTMNEQLNPPSHDQVETHASPLPVSFQTLCGLSIPHSDTTNDGPTDNSFQHLGVFTQMPTSHEYVVMREERTRGYYGVLHSFISYTYD